MDKKTMFFAAITLILAYLVFLIVSPYLKAILMSMLLAYIFYPIYCWLERRTGKKNLSAILTSLAIILLLTIPTLFLVNAAAQEANISFLRMKQIIATGNIFDADCTPESTDSLCTTTSLLRQAFTNPEVRIYLEEAVRRMTAVVISGASHAVASLPSFIIQVLIIVFLTFYFFKDGERLILGMKRLLPLKESHQDHVITLFKDTTYAVVYGSIVVALIQGILALVGYLAVGVNAPILWALITAIVALIPFLGTALVWVPISLHFLITGLVSGNTGDIGRGIGLLLYGALIVGTIDNFLKPRLIARKANIHPAVILIGVFGGLAAFGLLGALFGPVLISLFVTFLRIYKEEKI
ncbi:MAG TPA: AI-2E family transporter [Candidatus Nanoarchaeia archaeon]|nr:AI-2E family transporter [Candidatus Nanoarchaeia archaeon]